MELYVATVLSSFKTIHTTFHNLLIKFYIVSSIWRNHYVKLYELCMNKYESFMKHGMDKFMVGSQGHFFNAFF